MLRDLHAELRGYPGQLTVLAPLGDIPAFLARPQTRLTADRDLAASTASARLDARRILAAYGEPVDPDQLEVCQQLRRLHLTVWYNLYAERLPDLRPCAAELLTLWPAP